MRPATDRNDYDHREEREWILRCEGFQVYGPEGHVGVVVAVVYEHSARWDAPHGLKVRGGGGTTFVTPLDAVTAVDVAAGRISVDRTV